MRRPRTLIYQIFVDRFAGENGRALEPPPASADPWKAHAGGTLDGIVRQIDHIRSLGADAIYLTPIFRAETNHKYDTHSFDEVDPCFGGDGAFERLAAACKEHRMGLILDGVFNHVGERHEWFERARADAGSDHARYFKFARHPDAFSCWRGYRFLPELDLGNEELRGELFTKKRSVFRRWLRRGATGWRLDCANDLGFDVCRIATRMAKRERAIDGVIGEVMTWADEWVRSNRLDGVMSYYFRESVIGLVKGEVAPIQTAYNFERMADRYPRVALLRSWNLLSTHDTPRLKTLVSDARARRLAWTMAFAFPGVPLCYYGEEIGLEGGPDPDNRRPMIWDERRWDREMLAHLQKLAAIRKDQRALLEGGYLPFPQPGAASLIAFARTTNVPKEAITVVANASPEPKEARVFVPYAHLFDALPLADLLGGHKTVSVAAGRIDVELSPWQAAMFAADDGKFSGYSFFRGPKSAQS
jgi:alpha-glucosidase